MGCKGALIVITAAVESGAVFLAMPVQAFGTVEADIAAAMDVTETCAITPEVEKSVSQALLSECALFVRLGSNRVW